MAPRPKKPKTDGNDVYVHIRIAADLKAKLIVVAKASGMDLSNYCRAAMIEKAKREGHKV